MDKATFANGCFWCTEAIFQRLKGVEKVVSGYIGGKTDNPSYEKVSMGTTGHAEALQITFDPKVISYEKLLDVFWHTHTPTTLNKQGNDVGTQYRSEIFYHNDVQKVQAEKSLTEMDESGYFNDPIVTQTSKAGTFYEAEDYHQDYFNTNGYAPYCSVIIDPKVKKFLNEYKDFVKEEYK